MGCSNCSTCEVSEKRGCGTSSVFNWLHNINTIDKESANLVEVQFKSDRKEYYVNTDDVSVKVGDWIAVQGNTSGHDIGKISLMGELVNLQLKRKKRDIKKAPLKKIYRSASESDLEKWKKGIEKEKELLVKSRIIIKDFKLEMKLTDVEFQGDNTRATFYYTAESRVDFRELIREFSRKFGIRVEMKQIGVRQEAAKIGGIGSCGRELCCSTWMTEFPSVSTSAARYQQLAINPQKISGQCGRLKCCLNFELDAYTEALEDFPSTKTILQTEKGNAKFIKLDVFKKTMWYFYSNDFSAIFELSVTNINKIVALNKNGEIPEKLENFVLEAPSKNKDFKNIVVQDNINRFDKKSKPKTKIKKYKNKTKK